ncbi:unnamed protein product [Rotaria sordida]|uniref:VWA7 N-terminal domain-containing protein n=1 Tax=Rotaria sordida TaxID=392033 RepID=A0A819KTJ4_9BILA|nr:unnamed protein product [Rotaria sordida]CAF3954946.1 unnamed protein product [Rotaria sordida]
MYSGSCSKPKGKCSHGGLLDMITQTDAIDFGINKDNGNSDHGSFHTLATKIDPEWGSLTITTDVQFFIDKINNLTVDGGDDEPELYYHDFNEALQIDLTSSRALFTSTFNSFHLIDLNGVLITPVLVAAGTYFQLYIIENPRSDL